MAYDFNGSNQEISYANVPTTAPLSVSGWVWQDNLTNDQEFMGTDESDGFFTVHVDVSQPDKWRAILRETSGGGSSQQLHVSNTTATTAQWEHIFFSLTANSSTGYQLWLNGTEDANSPWTTASLADFGVDPNTINLGQSGAGGRDRDGKIAEVAMWNRVLDDAEIITLSKGYSPLFIPNGLYMYSPLLPGANDIVGGYAETITGATTSAHPRIIYPTQQQLKKIESVVSATAIKDLIQSGIIAFSR